MHVLIAVVCLDFKLDEIKIFIYNVLDWKNYIKFLVYTFSKNETINYY